MAFLRVEKKKSGTYIRIVQSYKVAGKSMQKTLYSLGKVEDYSSDQLERIGKKLIELACGNHEGLNGESFRELARYNYGYALVIQKLWSVFDLSFLVRRINSTRRIQFDWQNVLQLLIAERINDPCSKLASHFNQSEYLGLCKEPIKLHHIYRALDVLSSEEEQIKKHLFTQQRSLFSTVLDVVFYDVTTLYFDSQVEQQGALRQKGYSKDGKATKTQVVLGLLVDKSRNPITYQVYQGNTYEGSTMIEALKKMKAQFNIDRVVVIADTGMIDKENRGFMVSKQLDYIIGDSIKVLGKKITAKLINKDNHKTISGAKMTEESFTYTEEEYKGRRIICTYSPKRARKAAHQREKLIEKANMWLTEPSKYKQVKKRGAGKYITTIDEGKALQLNQAKITEDAKYDGYKALSTTTDLAVEDIIDKYSDLFEVEHAFRTLKSLLEIRPMYHWTDSRIKGHICMCFIAYTFINHLKLVTKLQYRPLVRALDKMQVSEIEDCKANNKFYLRSALGEDQEILISRLKLKVLNSTIPQNAINQYFM